MPPKRISPPGSAPTPASAPSLASLTEEAPIVVLAAPGSITPGGLAARKRLTHALAAGSLLAVALRPMPRPPLPRTLANMFTVTNTNAAGPGSLFQAVKDANANPGADTITFQPNLAGTIAPTATLTLKDSVTIIGPGPGVLSLSGAGIGGIVSSVFYLSNNSNSPLTATITGLTIRDGATNGGGAAITSNNFDLTLDQVDLISNTAGLKASGGALKYVSDPAIMFSLTIRNSLVSGNHAGTGAGIYLSNAKAGVTITNTQIVSNTALDNGGGVFLYNPDHVLIEDSTIMSNTAQQANGGGIAQKASGAGLQIIRRTTISGNAAATAGGGIYFANHPANVLVEDTTIAGNTATYGGGIGAFHLDGTSNTIRRTTISGNSASIVGGGVFVFNVNAPLMLENSTLSGNHTTGLGGGAYFYNPSGVSIQNSTIFSNSAHFGGGIQVANHILPISDTIIAGNVASALGPDITGTFQLRYDLVQVTGTATISDAGGNLFGLDPLLGPLADNGGPTRTHLPAHNSPAVNHGDPAFAPPPATDQRGRPRIVGGRVDIGSVEIQLELFLPMIRR